MFEAGKCESVRWMAGMSLMERRRNQEGVDVLCITYYIYERSDCGDSGTLYVGGSPILYVCDLTM